MPFFSVVIPAYNREKFIGRAIESIINQTFINWELIVVDDASIDKTFDIISHYKDPRIRVFRNKKNLERCVSRNKGIEYAKGKFICFLDSDDYHLPNYLEEFYQLIQEKGQTEGFFFTNAWDESEGGIRTKRTCPDFTAFNPYTYFLHFTVNPQRWAVHQNVFKKIKFDPAITICEDMDTSLRILNAGFPVFQLKERTTVYVAASDSFTHGDSQKSAKELYYLTKIFARPELKGKLPKKETNRLLSMCHYHLAIKASVEGKRGELFVHGIKSFLLCPKGYNGNTNKPLTVQILYAIPLLGSILKKVIQSEKK